MALKSLFLNGTNGEECKNIVNLYKYSFGKKIIHTIVLKDQSLTVSKYLQQKFFHFFTLATALLSTFYLNY